MFFPSQIICESICFPCPAHSNPFEAGASVLHMLRTSKLECPMYQEGFSRLQRIINDFISEVCAKMKTETYRRAQFDT